MASDLDANQCIQGAYNDANQALRVEGILANGVVEVSIDAIDDNIAIKDPVSGYTLKVNSDGSINTDVTTVFPDTVAVTQSTSPWVVSGTVTANQGTSPWVVSGTIAATQSGAWNINNITGTVSLPTGASTEATLSAFKTANHADLSTINTTLGSPFQAGGSISNTTFASTQSGAWTTGRTWTLSNSTDSISAIQGTSPWVVSGSVTASSSSGTLTDRSGTATGVSTQIMAANVNRKYLVIQNIDVASIYINFTSAATVGSGSIELTPLASFSMESAFISTEAINVITAGSSLAFTAKEG